MAKHIKYTVDDIKELIDQVYPVLMRSKKEYEGVKGEEGGAKHSIRFIDSLRITSVVSSIEKGLDLISRALQINRELFTKCHFDDAPSILRAMVTYKRYKACEDCFKFLGTLYMHGLWDTTLSSDPEDKLWDNGILISLDFIEKVNEIKDAINNDVCLSMLDVGLEDEMPLEMVMELLCKLYKAKL